MHIYISLQIFKLPMLLLHEIKKVKFERKVVKQYLQLVSNSAYLHFVLDSYFSGLKLMFLLPLPNLPFLQGNKTVIKKGRK